MAELNYLEKALEVFFADVKRLAYEAVEDGRDVEFIEERGLIEPENPEPGRLPEIRPDGGWVLTCNIAARPLPEGWKAHP